MFKRLIIASVMSATCCIAAHAKDAVVSELATIQKEGNAWVKPVPGGIDKPYQVVQKGELGDCDNYAAIKMKWVRERLPQLTPFFLQGYTRPGHDPRDYHAVLVVPYDGKWYILDNLSSGVMVSKENKIYLRDTSLAPFEYFAPFYTKVLR